MYLVESDMAKGYGANQFLCFMFKTSSNKLKNYKSKLNRIKFKILTKNFEIFTNK